MGDPAKRQEPWHGLPVDPAERIRAIRIYEVRIPLRPELRLAGRTISAREYLVVEIEVASGSVGTAYALTRGLPLAAHARKAAAGLLDSPLSSVFQVGDGSRSPGGRVRAVFDACGWDLLGALTGRPVWSLIEERAGIAAAPKPALAVAGYRRGAESDQAMAARLLALSTGVRALKLAPSTRAGTDLNGVLQALGADRVGPARGIVVDFGNAFEALDEALAAIRALPDVDVAWVEDPFPPPAAERTAALRAAYSGRVGAGDEQTLGEVEGLARSRAVDILRLDYTTAGGISELLGVVPQLPCRASFHVYPEIHRHLAAVFAQEVELFLPGDPFDFSDRLFHSDLNLDRDGMVGLSERPGWGLGFIPSAAQGLGGHIESASYAK